MAKDIDRQRAAGALAVIRQHPAMTLFALSPILVGLALVWWLAGAGWAIALLLVVAVGGGAVVLRQR
ncbi:hypothetical protein [Mycobacterium sp. SMC-4]|uniref:hypothetical protein n=1 Tax=Mycobacterium sp. SMC-4 TaxID=2857059 RepID=UPI0021B1DA44|nr:hypothetical protein [Mycobacterium sp. SMC-4]UXA16788.1 hypothetical protein KXD98_18690 [Mycobacterium sp. SMC-4]